MKSARLEQDRLPGQFFNLTLSLSFLRHGKERRICIDKSCLLADWLFGAKTPQWARCLLIHEVSRSHTTMHHSR